jgi:hypothetical protein
VAVPFLGARLIATYMQQHMETQFRSYPVWWQCPLWVGEAKSIPRPRSIHIKHVAMMRMHFLHGAGDTMCASAFVVGPQAKEDYLIDTADELKQ